MSKSFTSAESIDVLIVGGGFSTMPLVRELAEDGLNYLIVTEDQPIWKQLQDEDAIDFDLVSSVHSSFPTHELVEFLDEQGEDFKDHYSTAGEFYAMHRRYAEKNVDRIVRGKVSEILNFDDHSLVILETGEEYRAKSVVLATAFKRKIHDSLKNIKIDESFEGKTVAVTSTGDSSNLLMAKLVGCGAKVHLVTNGFIALDKVFPTFSPLDDGVRFVSLEQFECQNLKELSKWTYRSFIEGAYTHGMIHPKLASVIDRDTMAVKHPLASRPHADIKHLFKAKTPVEFGHIAIKYWPIDTYRLYCGDELEERVQEGYILNDLPFFIDQGYVKLWAKDTTEIDRENLTLRDGDNEIALDLVIDGDHETPNIPDTYINGDRSQRFSYEQRDAFMGLVPPELKNIYTVGYIRPFTGGLNNISEMQSLFTHRMITDDGFREKINANIDERIANYNSEFYCRRPDKTTDHLVYFGNYTDEVAKNLEIRPKLNDARSAYEVVKYYLFSNNAFYFREKGRYKVEGVDRLIRQASAQNHDYKVLIMLLGRYPALELLALCTIAFAPILWWIKPIAIVAHVWFPFTPMLLGKLGIPSRESKIIFWYRRLIAYPLFSYPIVAAVTLFYGGMSSAFWLSAGLLGYVYAAVNIGKALGWNRRYFCDMQTKRSPENLKFFDKYTTVFRRVNKQKANKRNKAAAGKQLDKREDVVA